MVLIPTPLIEFRYYILPFYFFILLSISGEEIKDKNDDNKENLDKDGAWTDKNTFFLGMFYMTCHIVVMYVFLYRTFMWVDVGDKKQRFLY